jgi:hypothetical protein
MELPQVDRRSSLADRVTWLLQRRGIGEGEPVLASDDARSTASLE